MLFLSKINWSNRNLLLDILQTLNQVMTKISQLRRVSEITPKNVMQFSVAWNIPYWGCFWRNSPVEKDICTYLFIDQKTSL